MEQIAYSLGFSDAAYFTRFFRKEVGQAPSQFRLAARERPPAGTAHQNSERIPAVK